MRVPHRVFLSVVTLLVVPGVLAAQSSRLDDFRHIEIVQDESDADPLDNPAADQIGVSCRVNLELSCVGGWFAPKKGRVLSAGDSIRVGRSYRATLNVELSDDDYGVVVLAPQVFTRENDTTFVGPLVTSGSAEYVVIEGAGIEVRRGAIIAKRCPGLSFVMVVNGQRLGCRGTTWLAAVDQDDGAWLYVQEGTLEFESGIRAGGNSAWTWEAGGTPRPMPITAAQAAIMRSALEYNGAKIWSKGFNPLVLLPLAVIPVVIFIADDTPNGDGLSGTVRIGVP